MYIKLIRNQPKGNALTGRLVINGRWFCDTLERVGYQIPALCYHVAVTMSPKFKRRLPIVQNVPRLPIANSQSPIAYRSGIRFHRGTKPEHSTGCVLVVGDNFNDNADNLRGNQYPCRTQSENNTLPLEGVDSSGTLSPLSSNKKNIGCRSAADVETQLTQLLLQAQQTYEEIILEVTDFRPGTEYGYNTPCPLSECAREKEIRSANFARRHSYLANARTIVSSSILEPTRLSDGC
ncbi:MAG: hypothetical protein J6J55_07295 [Paludibacteraceae bacterium]|nr:hypothetical protein [Paludibacteraceae bacterium]